MPTFLFQEHNCTSNLQNRTSFLGNGYIDNVKTKGNFVLCNIELSNVTNKDAGKWSCSMESYVLGHTSSGYKVTKSFNLEVVEPEEEGLAGRSGFTTPPATSTATPKSNKSTTHSVASDFPFSLGIFIVSLLFIFLANL